MKKNIFLLILLAFCIQTNAQQNIGIGTSTPHSSSLLDIKSNTKGMLVPRINLISETDVVTIAAPATSLLVYNTNNTLTDGEGFYFWNGTKWSKLMNRANVSTLAWGVTGNSGTNTSTDFIGTTDNKPLVFKTNNILSGKIDPGPNNVFFGQSAGRSITSGINNTFLGHEAGITDSSGSNNLFFGHLAGNLNSSGAENVFVGQDAGRNNTTGDRNTFIGEDAGIENISGSDNIFVGNGAGRANRISVDNIAIGNDALSAINTGNGNVSIGSKALRSNTSGSRNIAISYEAMPNNTTGYYNTAIGFLALAGNTEGFFNTAVGAGAMGANTTGSWNTALGESATMTPTLTNATVIGAGAYVRSSNTMAFGSSSVNQWIFGNSNAATTHAFVVGITSANGNSAYLTTGGTWTNASDVNKKEDFSLLIGNELLQKISQLSIQRWKYKGTNEYHIGPTAQDFHKLFGLGTDDKGISTVDPAGIALAAIQEQQKIIEKQNQLILLLEKRIEALEKK